MFQFECKTLPACRHQRHCRCRCRRRTRLNSISGERILPAHISFEMRGFPFSPVAGVRELSAAPPPLVSAAAPLAHVLRRAPVHVSVRRLASWLRSAICALGAWAWARLRMCVCASHWSKLWYARAIFPLSVFFFCSVPCAWQRCGFRLFVCECASRGFVWARHVVVGCLMMTVSRVLGCKTWNGICFVFARIWIRRRTATEHLRACH